MIHKNVGSDQENGFTLIELMLVLTLIGILATIGLIRIAEYRENAMIRVDESNRRVLRASVVGYLSVNGFPSVMETWDGSAGQNWENYLEEWPDNPNGNDYKVEIQTNGDYTITTI